MAKRASARDIRRDVSGILRAPRRMPVADAVSTYMRVPMGAGNSVPWDPDLAPYVIEPMNCLASREYDAVVFVGPARTGKTIGLIDGWIVYNIVCDPADMLVIQVSEEKAREHSKKRLDRTFRCSPEVKIRLSPRRNDNNVYDRTFRAGNYLKLGWPSVNIMSSSDYKSVALTDYDRFPEDIDGEGDAFSLASKRTTTFMSSGMTLEGNTQLTLVSNFTGPTQSGAAWSAVPRVALNMVTAALVAQSAEALRGLNYDKQNWQRIFTGTGDVPVILPDGTTWTGPAWNSITTSLSGKAAKGANSDITSLNGLTTALSITQGGTGSSTASGARQNLSLGNSATRDVGTVAGTVAAGDDARLNTVDGKTGGTLNSGLSVPGAAGFTVKAGVYNGGSINNAIVVTNVSNTNPGAGDWVNFLRGGWWTGEWTIGALRTGGASIQSVQIALRADNSSPFALWNFNANGQATGTWVNNSDRRIKDDVVVIPEPLEAMKKLRGYSWRRLDSGVTGFGFIAQEVQEVFPEAVNHFGQAMTMEDGTEVKDVLSVDTTGVSAALHHEAILAIMEKVEQLTLKVEALQSGS